MTASRTPHVRELDVLIFGGGVAGLWTLDRLCRAGLNALLLESAALGAGQTIQSQGIIHGGGKYALRGVRDLAAVRTIREMPERWRRHLRGEAEPDLRGVCLLSPRCLLWLPRGGWTARLCAWGFLPIVTGAGLLATRPYRLPADEWPAPLAGTAAAVYALDEPVVDPGSLVARLAALHPGRVRRYDPGAASQAVEFVGPGRVRLAGWPDEIAAGAVVLAAGAGTADLLARAGVDAAVWMQRRPLAMTLVRGALPPLFGHCVLGGKTGLTITSAVAADGRTVWQVGGEPAERLAGEADDGRVRAAVAAELRRRLPGVVWSATEIAVYRAVRAEARRADARRPSGVQVARPAPGLVVAWPTKLALAPLLADEVLATGEAMFAESGRPRVARVAGAADAAAAWAPATGVGAGAAAPVPPPPPP
ncbi:MAG: FAD-dependent oxidoreductase, partial [Planctomycetes bacterium]|nr:FAD-dependent oxidoreductase [Planctomycetota bacterium]